MAPEELSDLKRTQAKTTQMNVISQPNKLEIVEFVIILELENFNLKFVQRLNTTT